MSSSGDHSQDIAREIQRITFELERNHSFTNLEILGRGTYGDVLRAYDLSNQKWKAIKIIKKRFVKENELPFWSQLHHKNIVSVEKSLLMYNGTLIVVMPLQFRALDEIIGDERFEVFRESITYIKRWLFDCLKGMEYMHSKNLCHMDLKMDNILISHVGRAMLSDFTFINETRLTYLEGDVGVPTIYAPPEVVKWECMKIFGAAVDSWTFGMMVIEALTGSCLTQSITKCDNWVRDVKPILDLVLSDKMFESLVKTTYLKSQFERVDVQNSLSFIRGFLSLRPNKRVRPAEAITHVFISKFNAVKIQLQKVYSAEELRDNLKSPKEIPCMVVPAKEHPIIETKDIISKRIYHLTDFKSFKKWNGKPLHEHSKDNRFRGKQKLAKICQHLFRCPNYTDFIMLYQNVPVIQRKVSMPTTIINECIENEIKNNDLILRNSIDELRICGEMSIYTTVIMTGLSLVIDFFCFFFWNH